jgi:hypothetical protein
MIAKHSWFKTDLEKFRDVAVRLHSYERFMTHPSAIIPFSFSCNRNKRPFSSALKICPDAEKKKFNSQRRKDGVCAVMGVTTVLQRYSFRH